MKKQILAAALALLMLFSILPVIGSALTVITNIVIKNAVIPVPGETPDNSGAVADAEALTIVSGPAWCGSSYIPMNYDVKYQEGKVYYFRCVVAVNAGYAFIANNLQMDGELQDAAGNRIKLESILIENHDKGKQVTFGVKCEAPTEVKDVSIKGAVFPAAGENPDASGSLVNDGLYFAKEPIWCGKGYAPLKANAEFKAGQEYYYIFTVGTKPGYKFTPYVIDINGGMQDAAGNRIHLESIKTEPSPEGLKVTMAVICTELTEIDYIEIKDAVFPIAGEKPDASGSIATEGLYFVTPPTWCGKGYAPMSSEAVFEKDTEYYYRFKVDVKPGYKFTPLVINVNGGLSDAAGNPLKLESIKTEGSPEGILVTFAVICQEAIEIDYIEIKDAVFPIAGENPDASGSIATEGLYFVTPPTWCGKGYAPMPTGAVFEKDTEYYYRFKVNVKPGYKFTPLVINVNGGLSDAAGNPLKLESIKTEGSPEGILVTFAVICEEAIEIDYIEIKDAVFPADGEKPDASGALATEGLYFEEVPKWCGKGYTPLASDAAFEAGQEYYYRFIVNVKPGYKFKVPVISINGEMKDAAGNAVKLESIKTENDPKGLLVTMAVKCTEKPQDTFMLGDVNFDGKITAADARLALRRAVGIETYAEGSKEFKACDVDKNSKITAADARKILRAAVGLEDPKTW